MAYKRQFSKFFFSDLESALDYLEVHLNNANAAKNLYKKVKEEITSISVMPLSFPDCSYWYFNEKSFRHSPVGNYSIFFKVDEKNKTVIYLRFLSAKLPIQSNDILAL